MYRLSLIISEIYNKYLPLAEKDGIVLNLDFSDTTKEVPDPDRIKQYLDEHLSSALQRSDKGEITIAVNHEAITITDTATTLSATACALLSNRYIDVVSRVGFGTTVHIFLQPRDLPAQPTTEKPKLQVEEKSKPTAQKETKMDKRSLTKAANKTKRELSAAAKKADKKVKQIAKKAEKQAKKAAKQTTKSAKATGRKLTKAATQTKKSAKKTIRKLKLS